MKKFGLFLILGIFCFSLGFGWYVWDHFTGERNSIDAEEVLFEVQQGESFLHVVKELESRNLIRNAQIFSLYAKIKGEAGKMKVGEYAIRRNMYPHEVLQVINSGKSIGRIFTVPEGFNIYEISEMYEEEAFGNKEDFLKAARDPELIKSLLGESASSLEGYLFPESYQLTKFTTAQALVTQMVKKFMQVWSEIEPKAKAMGWSRNQVVTLASIVEKETGAAEERPLISSVFHNRLLKKMRLQTDPTVLYGKIDLSGRLESNISRADLTRPTRYNTYVIAALPPGPISNPSREALLATVDPGKSEYLYFVSKNEGRHLFSKDYKTHLEAVRKFQMDPKAREGKSWRNLKKTKDADSQNPNG